MKNLTSDFNENYYLENELHLLEVNYDDYEILNLVKLNERLDFDNESVFELINFFNADLKIKAESLKKALLDNDWNTISVIIHKISGSAMNISVERIGFKAKFIELKIYSDFEKNEIIHLINELLNFINTYFHYIKHLDYNSLTNKLLSIN